VRTHQRGQVVFLTVCVCAAGLASVPGCQTQGGGGAAQFPAEIIVWEDPESGNQGSPIRDANNDPERFVVVGTNGRVQFVQDSSVCTDCMTEGATIDLGEGNLIDIRFGVGVVGDDVRRPFLVDRTYGTFVQLVEEGGGIIFQPTDTPFEEPNDRTDDMAKAAGSEANPTITSTGARTAPLCGLLGAMMPLTVLALLGLRLLRRR